MHPSFSLNCLTNFSIPPLIARFPTRWRLSVPKDLALPDNVSATAAKDSPRSIGRVLNVLDALTDSPRGASLTELSQVLQIPKSSLLVMLKGMQLSGHVKELDKRYRLAGGAFDLAFKILATRPDASTLKEATQELWARSQETAVLTTIDRERQMVTYIDAIESPESVRYTVRLGITRGLHCTAAGLVSLAFQDDAYIDYFLSTAHLQRFTPNTMTDPDALRDRLEKIRRDGVVISRSEAVLNSIGIAAPVINAAGRVDHALLIAGPVERMDRRANELVAVVRDVAAKASAVLKNSG
nr:IclR family transcriptional regulator [Sphingobium sp. JAI105]